MFRHKTLKKNKVNFLFQRNNPPHNNVLEIGQHPDPIISDVCCYSQPCFDEAAKLFHKLGEGGSPDHGSLPVARYECLWPRESRQNM